MKRGWTLTKWDNLAADERAELLAYDELERERRIKLIDKTDNLNTETLLAWLWING